MINFSDIKKIFFEKGPHVLILKDFDAFSFTIIKKGNTLLSKNEVLSNGEIVFYWSCKMQALQLFIKLICENLKAETFAVNNNVKDWKTLILETLHRKELSKIVYLSLIANLKPLLIYNF